jgi:GT2 family glycosyltransferase
MKYDYSITFACLNQAEYTQKCIESLLESDIDLSKVVVVNNGSTDNTQEVIARFPKIHSIVNKQNLGCGVAWNQGALKLQTEWTVIMNNDVILDPGWLNGLFFAAIKNKLKVVCPAMIEGTDDYDMPVTLANNANKALNYFRPYEKHAVCMLIHQSVWNEIGFFRSVPSLFGFEDSLFFNELERRKIPVAVTGASWIHHFGSVTQNELKLERGLSHKEGLGDRKNFKLLGKSWLSRKIAKFRRIRRRRAFETIEISELGISLHGRKQFGKAIQWYL